MSAQENEQELIRVFAPNTKFVYDDIEYESQICSKPHPQTSGGEPITDVYIHAVPTIKGTSSLTLKISLKKIGWEFIKNHMQESDFIDVFFRDSEEQFQFYLQQCKKLLQEIPVIDLGRGRKINGRMGDGSITLGWEMMITNRPRTLSLGILPTQYVRESILGEHMEERRRHAIVDGQRIDDSGTPTHVLEMNIDQNTTSTDIIETMITVEEFIQEQQNQLHVILKANNYRSLSNKSFSGRSDGRRYLFVQNNWNVSNDNCLTRELDFVHPFAANYDSKKSLENAITQIGMDVRNVVLDNFQLCENVPENFR